MKCVGYKIYVTVIDGRTRHSYVFPGIYTIDKAETLSETHPMVKFENEVNRLIGVPKAFTISMMGVEDTHSKV